MSEDFRMYIDESGSSNLNHWDPNFTLCGVIVTKGQAERLQTRANQIKFKYWGRTDIVFHSHDIASKTGEFSLLKNPQTLKDFQRDMMTFLNFPYRCVIVSVDKAKAKSTNWNSGRILDEANAKMIDMFLKFLVKQKKAAKGQIVLESSSAQDIAFYKRYAFYLSHGFAAIGLSADDVKRTLTSISFVSKRNHDIEAQLADLLAYPATQKFLHSEGKKPMVSGSYLERMCNVTWTKLADLGPNTSVKACVRLP